IFWLDASEPQITPDDPGDLMYWAGPGSQVTNMFPVYNAQMFREGAKRSGIEPTITLSRSGWAGIQKHGAALWSGDIGTSWSDLQDQVRAGLNISISGIPWWTTDIGGFHGGDPNDPLYQELMIRWFQFGVFCPLFRLHGDREPRLPVHAEQTGGPNEIWSIGQDAYKTIKGLLTTRALLRPYIHEQMKIASQSCVSIMRPLLIDFRTDSLAWTVEDSFMFGPDLLSAPVIEQGSETRLVYLPEGAQ